MGMDLALSEVSRIVRALYAPFYSIGLKWLKYLLSGVFLSVAKFMKIFEIHMVELDCPLPRRGCCQRSQVASYPADMGARSQL